MSGRHTTVNGFQGVELQRGFTLIELLTVIAIIAILAAMTVGLAGLAARKAKIARTRAQLHRLITAIESYRQDFNQYPPDNAYRGQNISPVLNPLYYELTGTISTGKGQRYEPSDGGDPLTVETIQRAFNRKGFLNSAEAPKQPKNYLGTLRSTDYATIRVRGVPQPITLLTAPVPWPRQAIQEAPLRKYVTDSSLLTVNPWHYVSTNPMHNPQSYDLWVELILGKERRLIANWEE